MRVSEICFFFQRSALFDVQHNQNRTDVAESARKYADECQCALEEAYPGATVKIADSELCQAGYGCQTLINGLPYHREIDVVEQICDEVYRKSLWEVPRLWLNATEAHERYGIPIPVIRWACVAGIVEEAERTGGRWEFPHETFVEALLGEPLSGCAGIVDVRTAGGEIHGFECCPDGLLDVRAQDLPPGINTLIITPQSDFGIPLLDAYSGSVLISRRHGETSLMLEHFGSEAPWESRWTYEVYARALVALAQQHGIVSELDGTSMVEGVRCEFSFQQGSLTLREMIAEVADSFSQVVQATELLLSGAPIWKEAYEKDERLFCQEILAPLLRRMGYDPVRNTHGTTEHGRDFVFSERTRFGEWQHYGLQAKAGDVRGGVNSDIGLILRQIEMGFTMPAGTPKKPKYISVMIVAISGHFTRSAEEELGERLLPHHVGSVYFWDKDKVLTLIAKHWQE